MMKGDGPKFYLASSPLLDMATGQGHRLRHFILKFEMFFAIAFRDNFCLIIDRFTSILPQVTGNGLNFIHYHPNSTK